MDYNSHHYSLDSSNPMEDGNDDSLTLLNMRFCPYAQRVALILINKKIPFRNINIDLKKQPHWFKEINPLGKVPVLILPDKRVLIESDIICDYLDENFGSQEKLAAQNPGRKAEDKSIVALFEQAVKALHTARSAKANDPNLNEIVNRVKESFASVENVLRERKTNYFAGDEKPGMLDYMLWPWIERYPANAKLRPQIEMDPNCYLVNMFTMYYRVFHISL